MNEDQAKALREPFAPEQVGKLPRIICPNCSKAANRVCSEHRKKQCGDCGNYITERHIHLDYVGHAATTDRLLAVDPDWTWEPLASTAEGMPIFDAKNGLWIKLTIGGVTRLGYGDAEGQFSPKVAIGDAIRNAAMRFGVALDLWSKEDLHAERSNLDRDDDEKPETQAHDDTAPAEGSPLDVVNGLPTPIKSKVAKRARESGLPWPPNELTEEQRFTFDAIVKQAQP